MTSEIMIMNRQAVALAADSAVTYGSGPDALVTLEAEKILQINNGIALMVYSRGDVLGRSWSQIAHAFNQANNNKQFTTVTECAEAFFKFIDGNRDLFPEKVEQDDFEQLLTLAIQTVLNHSRAMRSYPGSPYESDEAAFEDALDLYRTHLARDEAGTPREPVECLSHLDRDTFYSKYNEMLDRILMEVLGEYGMSDPVRAKLYDFVFMLATMPAFLEPYAGCVFAGFGTKDVFPVYEHYYASIMVDGILKRAHDETTKVGVDDGPSAFVRTFAQADMTHAFLRGIHPMMFDVMISMNLITNEAAAEEALRQAGVGPDKSNEVMSHLQSAALPALTMEFIRGSQAISQHEFINPFISVMAASGKKQIAEAAKALVELNILKSDLHQQQTGVGGEVDVVMISQTAGLEWYNRKS